MGQGKPKTGKPLEVGGEEEVETEAEVVLGCDESRPGTGRRMVGDGRCGGV